MSEPWDVVREINRAWVEGHPDDMALCLHLDVVMVGPGFSGRSVGRDACIASYREFCDAAEIHEFAETDPHVDLTADTAVVTYRFTITYTMDAEHHTDRGHDLFVLTRAGEGWQVVWRTLVPGTESVR